MKAVRCITLGLLVGSPVHADDCEASIDNLSRWSGIPQEAAARQTSLSDCRRDVAGGDQEALISASCLANPVMEDAVACLSDALLVLSLEQCSAQPDVPAQEECRAATQEMFQLLPGQLEAMILSGQPQEASPPADATTLPPPPTRPGSCAQLMNNLGLWSGQALAEDELATALDRCERELQTQSETAIVVMCLSIADLDIASDCMVTEAIRANLVECESSSPTEQSMCEQMLLGMLEPMKTEMRRSIQDGSFWE